MKKAFTGIVFSLFFLAFAGSALAAERGSSAEAVAMVQKAVAYIKANGKEKALAEFSNPSGQFKDRDLYIFVVDAGGKMLAHGANPKLIGKNLMELKDVDGKLFVKEYLALAQSKGKGWTDYKWPNPSTSAIDLKSSYVEKVDDFVVGCGIYK